MLTIFNRRELIITMDMKRQAFVCDTLSQNKIKYTVKTKNLENSPVIGSPRGRTGSFGINQKYVYEYKIYVHKDDFEKAQGLIR